MKHAYKFIKMSIMKESAEILKIDKSNSGGKKSLPGLSVNILII